MSRTRCIQHCNRLQLSGWFLFGKVVLEASRTLVGVSSMSALSRLPVPSRLRLPLPSALFTLLAFSVLSALFWSTASLSASELNQPLVPVARQIRWMKCFKRRCSILERFCTCKLNCSWHLAMQPHKVPYKIATVERLRHCARCYVRTSTVYTGMSLTLLTEYLG